MAGPAAAAAASEFEQLADLLLDAAPREMLLQRLGQALAQTTRQVNTLERRLAPGLTSQVVHVRRTLEEREREERFRLRHVRAARCRRAAEPLPVMSPGSAPKAVLTRAWKWAGISAGDWPGGRRCR